MDKCIFCKIAAGETGQLVWENDVAAAFNDLHPAAPVHILVVPKQHIENLDHLEDSELAGKLLLGVREAAHTAGLKGRWKMKVNNGSEVGQTVPHLHFHLLGGKKLAE